MFVFFASIIKSQSNVENIYAPSAGYYSGGFLNLADDGLDAEVFLNLQNKLGFCLLYTSPSPRDRQKSRMPSSA